MLGLVRKGSIIQRILKVLRLLAMLAGCALLPNAAWGQSSPDLPVEDELPIVLLVDISSGQVLFSRNSERRFAPASMAKVMTLFHAFELMKEGSLNPRQNLTMSEKVWREWNGQGSTMWINAGDEVPVSDLLTGIANISANDAAIMLAEEHAGSVRNWLDGMNSRARELGMTQSYFGTPNGWPDDGYTFTTAENLVLLATALIRSHPQSYAQYVGQPGFSYNSVTQVNHDPLIGVIDGADGIKTGYTNEAGFGYLGSAERAGQRLVLVLGGARRYDTRIEASRDLIEWGFGAFDRQRLYGAGEIVGKARVQAGNRRSIDLQTDSAVSINVPRQGTGELRASIQYDGPLIAPLAQGEEVATLVIEVPGMGPARVPLYATQSVEDSGFMDRIFNGFAGWFS